jgi:DNA-binding protein Fis
MTAIVGVLNSQGIAIAADSAVTVSGNNVKKVYNRSNKIFTLSKFHPIGISIYNRADFMGMPLETLIKLYRKELKEKSFATVAEYKDDFLAFLIVQLKNVSIELKNSLFYQFCSEAHWPIIDRVTNELTERKDELDPLETADKTEIYNAVIQEQLQTYLDEISAHTQGNYLDVTLEQYSNFYTAELVSIENFIQEELAKEFEGLVLLDAHKVIIKQILYGLINIELIFESHCGLIFIGFGEDEIFPSSHLVLVGMPIMDVLRVRIFEAIKINPGVQGSNIIPYAQGDVTTTVLTGVDPSYKNEVKNAVKSTFSDSVQQIGNILANPELTAKIDTAMNAISDEFIQRLEDYQWKNITGPLLEILENMGKEDMAELAESLVNITSLKRKFTSSNSSDESVGGPVDVAIINKGDGFIWMKRKHYFEMNNNPVFKDKYFKT